MRKSEKCFIEVSKGNLDKVPDNYILNKELKGSIRYTTPEVDELERNLLSAIDKSKAIELELYE